MSPQLLVQLINALGPIALDLAPRIAAIWHKPALTPEEVIALCEPAKKSYDAYLADAKARLLPAA